MTVCHEGYLGKGRGMSQMLEAVAIAAKEADVRLMLLGRVVPAEIGVFEQLVKDLEITHLVDGPMWIDYSLLGEKIAQAQIGIVAMQPTPNNYLSLSNKLYNAMACGQALIVPKGSASADIVQDYACGVVVDTTKPEEIAEAIVVLAKNADMRQRFGAKGRKAIEEVLGWHRMKDRMRGIYQDMKEKSAKCC